MRHTHGTFVFGVPPLGLTVSPRVQRDVSEEPRRTNGPHPNEHKPLVPQVFVEVRFYCISIQDWHIHCHRTILQTYVNQDSALVLIPPPTRKSHLTIKCLTKFKTINDVHNEASVDELYSGCEIKSSVSVMSEIIAFLTRRELLRTPPLLDFFLPPLPERTENTTSVLSCSNICMY